MGGEDFYTFRKDAHLLENRCKAIALLKRQIDYLDYRHSPQRYKHTDNAFGVQKRDKSAGVAARMLQERKQRRKDPDFTPVQVSERESQWLMKSAMWEQQFEQELDELLKTLKKVKEMTILTHNALVP
eukprot:UN26331